MNMTNYAHSLDLVSLLETATENSVQFAVFPNLVVMMPRVVFTRRVPNKIAKAMHKVIRKKLELEKDIDEKTGEYLE